MAIVVRSKQMQSQTDDESTLGLLEALGDTVSRELITQVAARGTSMESRLIAIIKDEAFWSDDPYEPHYWLPLHAIMVLGLRDSEQAGLALADALQMCTSMGSDLGDELAGQWPALLRNKPDSVVGAFQTLFRTRADDEYCRIVSADVLTAAAQRQGIKPLNDMLKQLADVVKDASESLVFRQYMALLLLDFPRAEYRQLLESMAGVSSELGVMYAKSDVVRAFAEMKDSPEWQDFDDPWEFYSEDAIARRGEQDLADTEQDDVPDEEETPSATSVREASKVGRNNPCPCGSGKKYKKCCLPTA